jgi:hypothetical protein
MEQRDKPDRTPRQLIRNNRRHDWSGAGHALNELRKVGLGLAIVDHQHD